WISGIVEKFIVGLKKPEIRAITIDRQLCVHTKHDAVLKLPQESASAAGLAPELGNASAQFHHQVRILFHPLCYLVQVLCTISHTQSNRGSSMRTSLPNRSRTLSPRSFKTLTPFAPAIRAWSSSSTR